MSQWSPLDGGLPEEQQEPTIDVDGAHIPLSMAAEAVRRCTNAIMALDGIIANQGFAATGDLERLRGILRGDG